MEQLEGIVQKVIFAAPERTFCVFAMQDYQGNRLTVAAYQAAPNEGDEVEIQGHYKTHPKYGLQFQAQCIQKLLPHTVDGAIRLFEKYAIRGLGEKSIERIVAYFGELLPEVIRDHPISIMEVPGVRQGVKEALYHSIAGEGALKEITEFLASLRISTKWATPLYDLFGSRAIEVATANPYKLMGVLEGFLFSFADDMARHLGYEKDDGRRIEGAVLAVLDTIPSNGHTCLPIDELIEASSRLLGGFAEEVADTLEGLIHNFSVHYEEYDGIQYIYPHVLYRAETMAVARTLETLALPIQQEKSFSLASFLESFSNTWEIALGEEQQEAIELALTHSLSVITGGPGTGKTTIIKALVEGFQKCELPRILLCAPTGRAAKRLSEATQCEATTIHRLLEPVGIGDYEFLKNEDEPLDADVIIIDEASMLNIQLYDALLRAIRPETIVVLVGDVHQLPPIGAGFVLRDLLDSKVVPYVSLSHIYRQEEGNEIVQNAYRIHHGEMPKLVSGKEFLFAPVGTIEELETAIENYYIEALEDTHDLLDVQIISPMRKGTVGSHAISKHIQGYHTRLAEEIRPSIRIIGQELCVGDKVIQTTNNYELEIFNGEIGTIYALSKTHVCVRFPDKDVSLRIEDAQGLSLAYAITVHKSQGSEYDTVIIPFISAYHRMLQRNLLYTAVTRAKRKVVLIGSKKAIQTAIDTLEGDTRHTLFKERLTGRLEE